MKYYLLTPEQYDAYKHETTQHVVWTLDGSKCIIECEDSCGITEYIQLFRTANQCNEWRWDETTEEWRNWVTEEDYYYEL